MTNISLMPTTGSVHAIQTDSKTAQMAAQMVKPEPGARLVERFLYLRQILRRDSVNQSGVEVSPVEQENPIRAPIFFLDGEARRKRRAAIVCLLAPKTIATRHLQVMQKHTGALIAAFRTKGRGEIDDMSLHLSAAVVAEIVGLTNSNLKGMMRRVLASSRAAIAARRAVRQEDVVSRLAGMTSRYDQDDMKDVTAGGISKGERLSLHIRSANLDEDEVSPNPTMLVPARAKKFKANDAYMSFGDGDHFCPGWQMVLTETRIFLDRLVCAPDIHWVPPMLQSYELRNTVIECGRG